LTFSGTDLTIDGDILLGHGDRIQFDSADTYIAGDTSLYENLEIHADGSIKLKADDAVQLHKGSSVYSLGMSEGYTEIILTPTDFVCNDDSSYYNYAIIDSGGAGMIKSTGLEVYACVRIPYGALMVGVIVYGSSSYSEYFGVYTSSASSPNTSIVDTNTAMNSTLSGLSITGASGNYVIIKWHATSVYNAVSNSTGSRLYGALIGIK
jgi:hypothetical protein